MLPVCFSSYAIFHFHFKLSPFTSMFCSGTSLFVLCSVGTFSSKNAMEKFYRELYGQYKDEVLDPKYRGLKLYDGKRLS